MSLFVFVTRNQTDYVKIAIYNRKFFLSENKRFADSNFTGKYPRLKYKA